ncbi:MAG TPA: DNA-processing protein DprA [Thermoanaerobaculia bacterium]|nr:DNA-processing protein DprA [Thermoanaerobaculia bacterium]
MHDDAARDLLIALSLVPFLTPNRTRLLLENFDPVSTICNASPRLLEEVLSLTPEQAAQVRNPLTPAVAELRASTITLLDEAYPSLLRHIPDPPLALHFRGDPSLLARPALAMVGSRRASVYGINAAEHLARQLAPTGLVIVSGLALGIDSASHAAALESGGTTIAVLGTGIDVTYPRANRRLFERIEQHGLVITELPPGTPPRPERFPARNRIISGLAYGTLIVEATSRSGSLITARMAAEQGRDVFAVPGSIFSPGSEGTHRLIQYGAKLVLDADDVLHELRADVRAQLEVRSDEQPPDAPLGDVLAALTREEGAHIDNVAARLGRTPAAVAESLLQLELDGWIRALPGARYVRVR